MSMMMKLVNAAAGQSVGDEVFFIQLTTNTFRLVKLDFDAGTVTYGPNKSDGTYGDGDTGGNNRHPESMGGSYTYTANSNSTCIVGDDGYASAATYFNMITNWHKAKKIASENPNPTIVCCSFGGVGGGVTFNASGTNYSYTYRGTTKTYTGDNTFSSNTNTRLVLVLVK